VKTAAKNIGKSSSENPGTSVSGGDLSSPAFLLELLRIQQEETRAQKEENRKLLARIDKLQDQLSLLIRLLHGSKSEKRQLTQVLDGEQSLFADDELTVDMLAHKQEPIRQPEPPKKSRELKTGRVTFSKDLAVSQVITLKPDCDLAGAKLIGTEITTLLMYSPGAYSLKEYHREKYLFPTDGRIVIAEMPGLPIPKGEADATMLAHVTVSKYVDHLPFYRQTKIMAREGINIAESTLNGWFDGTCRLLEPLYNHLRKRILESHYIQADETVIPVQTKEKEGSTHKGYLWNFYSPPEGLMCFIYDKGRGSNVPSTFLKDFSGALQTDGYTAYNALTNEHSDRIVHLACLTHIRRYFDRSLDNDPDRANYALSEIGKLYAIEKEASQAGMNIEERHALRQEKAVPVLGEFKKWLDGNATYLLPQSRIGEAFVYTLKLWDRLMNYTTSGLYLIDNNPIENSIRPAALGRRNWMFAGSHNGAQRSAMMYSFFGVCKLHGVNPEAWLTDVLNRLPDHSILKLDELLPNNWKPATQK
jgi:transposase